METCELIAKMHATAVVPVIKLEDTSKAAALAKSLTDGGIMCAEITFRAAGADKVISDITKSYPEMLVGAGTVTTIEQADRAIDAGAKFMVAPGFNKKIIEHSLKRGVPFIPGVATSSEIEAAMELGLTAVKFFPAEQAGGIAYIKAVSAPYSNMRFMPTGGINENNILDYLAFDKVFCCGGSWMVPADAIASGDFGKITALSKAAMDKILGYELGHIGINCDSDKQALETAKLFCNLFGFNVKEGTSSVFASNGIEIMKSQGMGKNGHIAVKTNSISRAMANLSLRGCEFDESSAKFDDKKNMIAIYLKGEIGGFAVHLLQKK